MPQMQISAGDFLYVAEEVPCMRKADVTGTVVFCFALLKPCISKLGRLVYFENLV
jgi:hypothetical protein